VTELISINNLSVALQGKSILSSIDLSINAGDILGLVGPSGCGKTTLLNTIAGFIQQQQGQIHIAEMPAITAEHTLAPEHRNIGMIFQDYALFPHLTVEKNIGFGIDKLTNIEQQTRLAHLVELLELTELTPRFPHQLSGGQQQRVAIARALAPRPKLLLLDEPFSNIDARLRNELMLAMRSLLKKLNISAIFVTHNKDEVFTFADKIALMHQGKLLQVGSPTQVCQQPNSWQVADFLQLGSWLPVHMEKRSNNVNSYNTALGEFQAETTPSHTSPMQLLLRNQHIHLDENGEPNSSVTAIKLTEQGFQYQLASLDKKSPLAFENLHFYSNSILTLEQEISLTIKAHQPLTFVN